MEKVGGYGQVRKLGDVLTDNGCMNSVLTTMNCVKEKSIIHISQHVRVHIDVCGSMVEIIYHTV